jgi:hypothetical protein
MIDLASGYIDRMPARCFEDSRLRFPHRKRYRATAGLPSPKRSLQTAIEN